MHAHLLTSFNNVFVFPEIEWRQLKWEWKRSHRNFCGAFYCDKLIVRVWSIRVPKVATYIKLILLQFTYLSNWLRLAMCECVRDIMRYDFRAISVLPIWFLLSFRFFFFLHRCSFDNFTCFYCSFGLLFICASWNCIRPFLCDLSAER